MVDLPIWPSEDYHATEDRWEKMVSSWWSDGVVSSDPTSGLFRAYGDSSGMVVKVAAESAAIMRGFFIYSEDLETVTIVGADAQPRVDLVVLQTTTGGASALGKLIVKKGTPAASNPSPPSLTNSDTVLEQAIARVDVGAGVVTIRSQDVTDLRTYAFCRMSLPVGSVMMFYGTSAPEGWLPMRGQSVLTASYPTLARFLGLSAFTNMTIPDMTDMVPRGLSGSVGTTGGSDTVTLSTANMPAHSHSFSGTWSGGNHGHQFYPTAHSHSASQPAHNHGLHDPGHRHGVGGDQGFRFIVTAPSSLSLVQKGAAGWNTEVSITNMDAVGTGIYLDNAQPGVNVDAASANGVVDFSGSLSGSVSGTVGSQGSGSAATIIPRHRTLLFCIKAA